MLTLITVRLFHLVSRSFRFKTMAELLNLGRHCSAPDCHQLDFLPFQCKHCSATFCKEHFNADLHSCERQPSGDISKEERTKNTDVYKCSVEGCEKTELASVR